MDPFHVAAINVQLVLPFDAYEIEQLIYQFGCD
jgi:hypothetical protein